MEINRVLECKIPRKYYDIVLGDKGANVIASVRRYSVSIQFSPIAARSAVSAESGAGGGDLNASAVKDKIDPPKVPLIIWGEEENCLNAREALLGLLPRDMGPIPFGFYLPNRYIPGVGRRLPRRSRQRGPFYIVKGRRDHRETIQVPSRCHTHIIASHCPTISSVCDKLDVDFEFHYKAGFDYDEVVIVGSEYATRRAKRELVQIMQELQEYRSKEVDIDWRIHAELSGHKGKVNEHFNVVIDFPLDKKSSKIKVTGMRMNVEEAINHLLRVASYLMVYVLEGQ